TFRNERIARRATKTFRNERIARRATKTFRNERIARRAIRELCMSEWRDILLTLAVVSIFALIAFGVWGLKQKGPKTKPWLMIAAGLVTLFNLWLYLLPAPASAPPAASVNQSR
ncbi:MAG: hypothetical protein ACRCUI_03895, partial [Polymorphobacter sp.]